MTTANSSDGSALSAARPPAGTAQHPPAAAVESAVAQVAKAMEGGALRPTLAVGVVGITVGALVSGIEGAVGGLLAVLLVLGSGYLMLFVMRRAALLDPMIVFAIVMGTYAFKVGLLLLFGLAFSHTGLFDRKVFGFTMAAAIVVWATGQAIGFRRAKVPTIIPVEPADPSPTEE